MVAIYVVLVSLYPLSLAGHLSQRRTFIYYCTSIRLCIGRQAALASAEIRERVAYISILYVNRTILLPSATAGRYGERALAM